MGLPSVRCRSIEAGDLEIGLETLENHAGVKHNINYIYKKVAAEAAEAKVSEEIMLNKYCPPASPTDKETATASASCPRRSG